MKTRSLNLIFPSYSNIIFPPQERNQNRRHSFGQNFQLQHLPLAIHGFKPKIIRSPCCAFPQRRIFPSSRRSSPAPSAICSAAHPTSLLTLAVHPICPRQAWHKSRLDMGTLSSRAKSNSAESHQQRQTRHTTTGIEPRGKKVAADPRM